MRQMTIFGPYTWLFRIEKRNGRKVLFLTKHHFNSDHDPLASKNPIDSLVALVAKEGPVEAVDVSGIEKDFDPDDRMIFIYLLPHKEDGQRYVPKKPIIQLIGLSDRVRRSLRTFGLMRCFCENEIINVPTIDSAP